MSIFLLYSWMYLCWQVFSQPLFANVEKWFGRKFPGSGFVHDSHTLKLPLLPDIRLNLLRLCFRSVYVVSTTGIAMIFPYFNQVLGVHGSLIFWPLSIYFPVEMYFKQRNIQAWTTKWVILRTFSIFCLLVTLFALIGSIQGLISAKLSWETAVYTPLGKKRIYTWIDFVRNDHGPNCAETIAIGSEKYRKKIAYDVGISKF